MPDCIYHCGYCGGILKEGPQFKDHVMSCYEEIGQQNVDQNHDALLKVIKTKWQCPKASDTISFLNTTASGEIC